MLPFFGRVITSDWFQGVGHSPVCQILLQMLRSKSIMVSAWSSSAGILSAPALFPGLSDFTAASTSSRRMGRLSVLVTGGCFSTSGSPLTLWLYSSEQYSVHLLRISVFCEALPVFILYGGGTALFWTGQIFHQLISFLAVVLPKAVVYFLAPFLNPSISSFHHAFLNLLDQCFILLCSFCLFSALCACCINGRCWV